MTKPTITTEQHINAINYKIFSESEVYSKIMEDLKNEILKARTSDCRIEESEKMFMRSWMINGFENCKLYIEKQVERANDVENGLVDIAKGKEDE